MNKQQGVPGYAVGDFVTFNLLANLAATVQIVENHTNKTSYRFSDGEVGATDDGELRHWRFATATEATHWHNNTVEITAGVPVAGKERRR